ncbi:hypothetical protein [Alishewanella longhuensis]
MKSINRGVVMDRAEALKATRNGAIAATISGIITLVVVLFALSSNANGDLGLWNDPLNFFDIALVFLCAFGIYRKSRAAAIVLFLYFIFAKVIIGLSLGRVPGLLISLIFFYYFAKAIQGTVVFHRIEKKENPEYRGAPSWYYFCGYSGGAVLYATPWLWCTNDDRASACNRSAVGRKSACQPC